MVDLMASPRSRRVAPTHPRPTRPATPPLRVVAAYPPSLPPGAAAILLQMLRTPDAAATMMTSHARGSR